MLTDIIPFHLKKGSSRYKIECVYLCTQILHNIMYNIHVYELFVLIVGSTSRKFLYIQICWDIS